MAGHFRLLPVFLFALFTFSVSGQNLIASINCGASVQMTDGNSITWSPDENLVSNGVARVVQSQYSNSLYPFVDSLRVFTSRKKNCYFIGSKLKGVKVLVRANFNYGNYDGLRSPPTFDLHFDGNFWATVQTKFTGIFFEATYVAKGDSISVCVAQTTPGQFPFISALEVRRLDSEVYSQMDEDRALFLSRRDSFGAILELRYPSDDYDRIWRPAYDLLHSVTNKAVFVDTKNTLNNPPSKIFQNAITTATTADSLYLGQVSPSNPPIYANMYFSEVTFLGSSLTRWFRVYDATTSKSRWLSDPISPPYGGVSVLNFKNYSVDSVTDDYLIATSYSDLPPLINAIEVFYISNVLTDGTNSNDVEALALLQSKFSVLGEWSGDPCLPTPYSWDWLTCSNDASPRVTSLRLDGFDLSGSLPDISTMDALEIIDLHNNSLTGTIPSFLGTMPNLQQLNLADNKFSGPIPTSLSKNSKLKLTVTGNPSLCSSGKSCSSPGTINSSPVSTTVAKKKKSSMLPVILGTTISAFFLIWIAAGLFIIFRMKTKMAANKEAPHVVTTGGGATGNPEGVQIIGEEMAVNENMENEAQRTFDSPSPLLDTTSGQTSNLYRPT